MEASDHGLQSLKTSAKKKKKIIPPFRGSERSFVTEERRNLAGRAKDFIQAGFGWVSGDM